jgi:hypothetical protein
MREMGMVDLYTKVVLTVIAAALVMLLLRDVPVVGEALVQGGWYRGDTVPVTIRGIDECTACRWESLPVHVTR